MRHKRSDAHLRTLPRLIFMSRWLQMPFYLGLIVVQALYAFRFVVEVVHLIFSGLAMNDIELMLAVLGLIDVVLISNLLITVIIGGYETYVSRLGLEGHPDEPVWLSHFGTGTLKIKLSLSLIGISSIHLLEAFINSDHMQDRDILWKVVIHLTFVASSLILAFIDRLEPPQHKPEA